MRKTFSRARAILGRVLRDPALLPEVLHKAVTRFTAHRHTKRVATLSSLAVEPAQGIAQLLGLELKAVQDAMDSASLRKVVDALTAYEVPAQARQMGGAAFLEVCYTVARLTKPKVALETGVAHGYSTAVILQALQDNQAGKLYSVDLPSFQPGVVSHTGGAIPQELRDPQRWELTLGPDRRVLPSLLKRMGPMDFVLYDSDKSYEGMMRTWKLIWPHLSPGAVLILDDIHAHDAFLDFADAQGLKPLVVSKPTRQGVYRWEATFYVGLIRKPGI